MRIEGTKTREGVGDSHLSPPKLAVSNDHEVTDDGVLRDVSDGTGRIEDGPGTVVAVNL